MLLVYCARKAHCRWNDYYDCELYVYNRSTCRGKLHEESDKNACYWQNQPRMYDNVRSVYGGTVKSPKDHADDKAGGQSGYHRTKLDGMRGDYLSMAQCDPWYFGQFVKKIQRRAKSITEYDEQMEKCRGSQHKRERIYQKDNKYNGICVEYWEVEDIDECQSKPCGEHDCHNTYGSFHCMCAASHVLGLDGQCHQKCNDQGHYDQKNGRCLCKSGWTGLRCDVDIDECVASRKNGGNSTTTTTTTTTTSSSVRSIGKTEQLSVCKNGGVCQNMPGGYRCRCDEFLYSGIYCEKVSRALPQTGTDNTTTIIAVGAGVITLMAAMAGTAWQCYVHARHAKRRRRQRASQVEEEYVTDDDDYTASN